MGDFLAKDHGGSATERDMRGARLLWWPRWPAVGRACAGARVKTANAAPFQHHMLGMLHHDSRCGVDTIGT